VVLAGSNDITAGRMRVYASRDAGAHWSSSFLPRPRGSAICGSSDPAVAIDRGGRQYYASIALVCRGRDVLTSELHLAARAGPDGVWSERKVELGRRGRLSLADDRPAIAVDTGSDSAHRGRVYLAWTRFRLDPSSFWADPDAEEVEFLQASALVSRSDDGGRTWARPVTLSSRGVPIDVRLAVARDGSVFAVWRESRTNAVSISRSADGRSFGEPKLVAPAVVTGSSRCHTSRARIPAQPRRCVSSNPVVSVDPRPGEERVYVTWGSASLNRSQDVYVAAFDPDLKPLLGVGEVAQVNPPEPFGGPDQFLPASAVDPSTGRLWACYYQTRPRDRRRARFTCTASDDGARTWSTPVPATTVWSDESRKPANVDNGYGDYEAVAAARGRAIAGWTDGRALRASGEEVFAAVLR